MYQQGPTIGINHGEQAKKGNCCISDRRIARTFPSNNAGLTVNSTTNAARAMWHFAQVSFQESPDYMPIDNRISIWTVSYSGRYGRPHKPRSQPANRHTLSPHNQFLPNQHEKFLPRRLSPQLLRHHPTLRRPLSTPLVPRLPQPSLGPARHRRPPQLHRRQQQHLRRLPLHRRLRARR